MTNEPTGCFKVKFRIAATIGRISILIILLGLVLLRSASHVVDLVLGTKLLLVIFTLCLIADELDSHLFAVRAIGLSKEGVVRYDRIGATPSVPYGRVQWSDHAVVVDGVVFTDRQVKNLPELLALLPPEVLDETNKWQYMEEEPKKNRWRWLQYVFMILLAAVSSFVDDPQLKGWLGAGIVFCLLCYQVWSMVAHLQRRKAGAADQIDQRTS